MRRIKSVIAALLAAASMLTLAACGLAPDNKIGAKKLLDGIPDYDDSQYCSLTLYQDIDYGADNCDLSAMESGRFEFQNNVLHVDGLYLSSGIPVRLPHTRVDAWDIKTDNDREFYSRLAYYGENGQWIKTDEPAETSIELAALRRTLFNISDIKNIDTKEKPTVTETDDKFIVNWIVDVSDADCLKHIIQDCVRLNYFANSIIFTNPSYHLRLSLEFNKRDNALSTVVITTKPAYPETWPKSYTRLDITTDSGKTLAVPDEVKIQAAAAASPEPLNTPEPEQDNTAIQDNEAASDRQISIEAGSGRYLTDGRRIDPVIDQMSDKIKQNDPDYKKLVDWHYEDAATLYYKKEFGGWVGELYVAHIEDGCAWTSTDALFERRLPVMAAYYDNREPYISEDKYLVYTDTSDEYSEDFVDTYAGVNITQVIDGLYIQCRIYDYTAGDPAKAMEKYQNICKTAGIQLP